MNHGHRQPVTIREICRIIKEEQRKIPTGNSQGNESIPQYYSEVEKGRSSTFTAERLKLLARFLLLDDEESHVLYDMAAESRSSNDIVTPQDCADYMLGNSYVIEALRLSMETGAGEKEWQMFLDDLKARKG